MSGQRDIVLIVKCEMFFLFAWDNNWEYMDLPIHASLLWQHFFTKYLKASAMKGIKLAIKLEEFHAFVLSLCV